MMVKQFNEGGEGEECHECSCWESAFADLMSTYLTLGAKMLVAGVDSKCLFRTLSFDAG